MARIASIALMLLCTLGALGTAAPPEASPIEFEPLDCLWTFGNHEPISMYRRIGKLSTGGIQGNARWLEQWHHWFDSEAAAQTMQELGLNILHSRFYKGMGWNFESRDFPNVKQFVANCHKHGIRVLAYVQFSTLYYEVMQAEVPDLADWAIVDENGRKRTYHGGSYYRWLPCVNAPGFEPYLKKVIRIALEEGGFDGIMFDNCFAPPCYCRRCAALFREHLARIPNPESRFGLPTVAHVLPPAPVAQGEVQDPIYQQWLEFRCQRLSALFRRLYREGKACKPSAIMTGNVANLRQANKADSTGLCISDLKGCFDIFVSQSGNEPGVHNGCIINRVREIKLAQALGTHILALGDADAGISSRAGAKYVLPLAEDAVYGGIPTDRTIMKADPQMVSRQVIEARRPLLQQFRAMVQSGREGLNRPCYAPVRLLYSRESMLFSLAAYRATLVAEEILLRNHVPFGLLPTGAATPLAIPEDCEVLVVCDQRCLSDSQIEALVQFARRGGRLIATGETGVYDERYAQRAAQPLDRLERCRTAIRRREVDTASSVAGGWTIKVGAPTDGGKRLLADLAALWSPSIRVTAPVTVLAEVKRSRTGISVHLLNYASEPVAKGIRVTLNEKTAMVGACTFAAPMEEPTSTPLTVTTRDGLRTLDLPAMVDYGVVDLPLAAR